MSESEKLVSVPGTPTVPHIADSPPVETWQDKEHRKTIEEENLEDIDPRVPEFTISTNMPMKCVDRSCHQPIDLTTPFLILHLPKRGAIFIHMICLGINTDPDNIEDVHWIAHIKRRFIDNLMRDKLYGRRTTSS